MFEILFHRNDTGSEHLWYFSRRLLAEIRAFENREFLLHILDPDIRIPCAIRRESDPFSVGGPLDVIIVGGILGDLSARFASPLANETSGDDQDG